VKRGDEFITLLGVGAAAYRLANNNADYDAGVRSMKETPDGAVRNANVHTLRR
jgi:hypothetical protein